MDIVEFLEARICEDEERAAMAARHFPATTDWWAFTDTLHTDTGRDKSTRQGLRHADKHSPNFVLAECAAKRAIIAYFRTIDKLVDPVGRYTYLEKVLIPLARPFDYEGGGTDG